MAYMCGLSGRRVVMSSLCTCRFGAALGGDALSFGLHFAPVFAPEVPAYAHLLPLAMLLPAYTHIIQHINIYSRSVRMIQTCGIMAPPSYTGSQ